MNDSIKFYFVSDDYYAALREAILSARHRIDLEMYIFASDKVGMGIAELLAQKAHEGVEVRVLYDSVGSQGSDAQLWNLFEENGVEAREFNPTFPLPRNIRRRNHRKVLIVDDAVGFFGGFNLMDVNWRDTGVRLQDPPLVQELSRIFELNWEGKESRIRDFLHRRRRRPRWWQNGMHIISSYGGRRFSRIRQEYLAAIIHAQHRIWITNPYFIPDLGMIRTLSKAAKRGVDVRVLTTGPTDVRIARWAAQALYSRLLRNGVRIFEYQPAVLHAKSAVLDEAWFTVGTCNFDQLSFFHNLEVNLFGKDAEAAQVLATQFQRDLESSAEIFREQWRQRSAWEKFRQRVCYYFCAWM